LKGNLALWAGLAAGASLVAALAAERSLGWAVVACVLLAAVCLLRAGVSTFGVFSPFSLASGGFILYTLPAVLGLAAGAALSDERGVRQALLIRATLLTIGALCCLALGYLMACPSAERRPWRLLRLPHRRSIAASGWLLVACGVAALALYVLQVGGIGRLLASSYGERFLLAQGKGYLLVGLQIASVGGTLLYVLGSLEGRRGLLAGALLVGLLLATWTGIVGSRGAVARYLLAVAVAHHLAYRPIRALTLAWSGALLLVVLLLVGLVRGRPQDSLAILQAAQSQEVNIGHTEFGAPLTTLGDVMSVVPVYAEPRLGATYLAAPGLLVPSAIWPSRPLGAGEWYAATFYADVRARGGAFAFSPVAEAYLNFGPAGVVVIFALAGIVLARLERRAVTHLWTAWGIAGYAVVAPWVLMSPRLDAATALKSGVVFTLGPLLVARVVAAGLRLVGAYGGRPGIVRQPLAQTSGDG
jgi:hypothetical protein